MTKEGVEYNFKRIAFFTNFDDAMIMGTGDVKDFIQGYGRIMDIMGSGNEQHSLLILTKSDFQELKKWCFDCECEGFVQWPKSDTFMFKYDGYRWYVKPIFEYPTIEIKKNQ